MGSAWGSSPKTSWIVASAAALAVASPAVWLALHERAERGRLELEVAKHQQAAEKQTKLRDEERRGRTRAEQRLRQAGQQAPPGDELPGDGSTGTAKPESESADSEGFVFHPIGTFFSCYRSRCGTPRQGGVVSESLAVLRCSRDLNPAAALEGFEAYSHCWVLYVFHENTNLQREGTTIARRQQRGAVQQKGRVPLWQGLCMKVAPPRCPDKSLRVGVLSCRTPHRPNPVGLSLARIVRVDKKAGEVILAGLDVVDGTPCLDLKPYLPSYECIPNATVPDWVQASYDEPLMHVSWEPAASTALSALLGLSSSDATDGTTASSTTVSAGPRIKTYPFDSAVDLRRALEGTLALDIRSPVQRTRHPNPGVREGIALEPFFVGDLWFHELHVTYALLPDVGKAPASVCIKSVERRPVSAPTGDDQPVAEEA